MDEMVEVEELFKLEDPFHMEPAKLEKMKFEVIKKAAVYHYDNCPSYKKICRNNNFNPTKDLKSYENIVKIPWITSKSFKKSYNLYQNLISVPTAQITQWLHSSGTSGDPSFVGRDQKTLDRFSAGGTRALELLLGVKRFHKGIVFGPHPETIQGLTFALGMKIWTSNMCDNSIFLMKERSSAGKMPIDMELMIKTLRDASKSKDICNLGGSSPLTYITLLNYYKQTGESFELNEKSFGAGFGGGWKTFTGQQISRTKFREDLNKILGIPVKHFRDIYALTETDMIFNECEEFFYHVPPWGDLIFRDPETMAPVKEGKKGLLNVINPLATSWPGISILLDDVAVLISEKKCKCGRYGKSFNEIERAVGVEARGCGAMITDLAEH